MMEQNLRAIIFPICIVLFLLFSEHGYSLDPGKASGKLSLNNQTFYIKHAYAKKTQDQDGRTTYLVLLTNRPFPEDLSKLSRFELNRYAVRYEIEGVVIGIDESQNLSFADVLRASGTLVNADFEPGQKKEGSVRGRVFTKKLIDDLKNRIQFDISFNSNP